MKLLGYCLLCLFAARAQSKPQITKLFPVEGLVAYHQQMSNDVKPLDKFLGKLRAAYNLVFRQSKGIGNVNRILAKSASDSYPQALTIIWTNQTKLENYTDLKYPNNSLVDEIKSLSVLEDRENRTDPSGVEKYSFGSAEITLTNKTEEKSSNETKTLNNDDWLNDIQPLERLELQDEELDKKEKVETAKPATNHQFPTTVTRHVIEWLGSFLGLTYSIYAKLSSALFCGNEKVTQ